jgi:lipoprotein Spr
MRTVCILLTLSVIVSACNPSARFRSQTVSSDQTTATEEHPSGRVNNLEKYISSWLNTPYQYGGSTKNGTDCSGFSSQVLLHVYHIEIPRTAEDQYHQGQKIRDGWLSQGDLVFFKNVRGRGIDHVGVFLGNGRFAHATNSAGVIISDLEEDYYRERYVGACRYR